MHPLNMPALLSTLLLAFSLWTGEAACPEHLGVTWNAPSFSTSIDNVDVLVIGDMHASEFTTGRVVVGGNAYLGSFKIGQKNQTTQMPYALVCNGDLTVTGTASIEPDAENVYVGGNMTLGKDAKALVNRRTNKPCIGCLGPSLQDVKADIKSALSKVQGSGKADCIPYQSDTLVIKGGYRKSAYWCSADASVFNNAARTLFNGVNMKESLFIFLTGGDNVRIGATVTNVVNENIFYVVEGKKTVTVTGDLDGSIIALDSVFIHSGGTISGQVMVGEIQSIQATSTPDCGQCDCCYTSSEFQYTGCDSERRDILWNSGKAVGNIHTQDYNLIVLNGSIDLTSGDVEGWAIVSNNLVAEDFSCGYETKVGGRRPQDRSVLYSLIVGDHATVHQGSVDPVSTSIFAGGGLNGPPDLVKRWHNFICEKCLALDDLRAEYKERCASLSGLQPNVNVSFKNAVMYLSSNEDEEQYVVSMTDDFQSVGGFVFEGIDLHKPMYIIFKEGSESITFPSASLPGISENIVYVIPGARTLISNSLVYGSIWAPEASLLQYGGLIEGQVVVADYPKFIQVNILVCGGCKCCKDSKM